MLFLDVFLARNFQKIGRDIKVFTQIWLGGVRLGYVWLGGVRLCFVRIVPILR